MTQDYKPNDNITLFAVFDVNCGILTGQCMPRHRAKAFIQSLRINCCIQKHPDTHLVLNNRGAHETNPVHAWLALHPRFKLYFRPMSTSSPDIMEGFFPDIKTMNACHGTFRRVAELEESPPQSQSQPVHCTKTTH
jgi:hypothetical protein